MLTDLAATSIFECRMSNVKCGQTCLALHQSFSSFSKIIGMAGRIHNSQLCTMPTDYVFVHNSTRSVVSRGFSFDAEAAPPHVLFLRGRVVPDINLQIPASNSRPSSSVSQLTKAVDLLMKCSVPSADHNRDLESASEGGKLTIE